MKVKGETTWTQCLGNLYKITGLQGRIVELLCFGVYDLPSSFLSDTYHLSFYLYTPDAKVHKREGRNYILECRALLQRYQERKASHRGLYHLSLSYICQGPKRNCFGYDTSVADSFNIFRPQ